VVVLNGNRIEEFDYENTNFQQLKGNVYLARVTRVEPSLQAAFVEYGGNRQGFLAFSEIHPDYYRIPVEDRDALVAEVEQADREISDEAEDKDNQPADNNTPETLGGDDEDGHSPKPAAALAHRYKIQEVITRKQILLVQVVKEERGNKGAALTTYLSLAGRYCVLMPNSSRSGGVSRKITNIADRKRLKAIVGDLDVPKGMAVIVRTAGSKRTKTEIKRDYAYLSKLWDEIRTKTLKSEAPALIHEEGTLVKRSVRDLYTNDVEEVLVEGDEAYKTAKAQMKMLIPSHAKRVIKHEDKTHLFQAYHIEPQLDTIHQNEVTLKSGGYLVINQTEALVAIDVNSGKATKERNIEETALKTNLEAAEEVGRQLRLRDLSGLIVIDFIDMDENRNQHAVERRLKDALRHDRARIQVGSISHFGLLEMSRQRLRPSLVESVSQSCPHCLGTGRVRSVNSSALHILRLVEDEAARAAGKPMTVFVHPEVALYILNQKRTSIAWLEQQFGLTILIEADGSLLPSDCRIDGLRPEQRPEQRPEKRQNQRQNQSKDSQQASRPANENPAAELDDDSDDDQPRKRRRGRRGGRRRKKRGETELITAEQTVHASTDETNADSENDAQTGPHSRLSEAEDTETSKSSGRRRRRRRQNSETQDASSLQPDAVTQDNLDGTPQAAAQDMMDAEDTDRPAKAKSAKAAKKTAAKAKAGTKKKAAASSTADDTDAAKPAKAKKAAKAKPAKAAKAAKSKSAKSAKTGRGAKADAVNTDTKGDENAAHSASEARTALSSVEMKVVNIDDETPPKSKKAGWWSR